MRIIYCQQLQQEAEGLARIPYPGALGQRIFDNISKEAWKLWLTHQTLLINENRLNLLEAGTRQFLEAEMEKFLFSEDAQVPKGFTPIQNT